MTGLIVRYDETGRVRGWDYTVDDEYEPRTNELVADSTEVDHRDLESMRVNLSEKESTLVTDPDWQPEPKARELDARLGDLDTAFTGLQNAGPLRRGKVSQSSRDTYLLTRQAALDAKAADDLQAQLDAHLTMLDDLYHILTGDDPSTATVDGGDSA